MSQPGGSLIAYQSAPASIRSRHLQQAHRDSYQRQGRPASATRRPCAAIIHQLFDAGSRGILKEDGFRLLEGSSPDNDDYPGQLSEARAYNFFRLLEDTGRHVFSATCTGHPPWTARETPHSPVHSVLFDSQQEMTYDSENESEDSEGEADHSIDEAARQAMITT